MINGWPALRMLTFVSTDLLSLFRPVFPGFICSSHSFLMASTSLEHIIMDLRLHVLGFFRLSNLILFKRATFSTPSHYHSRFHFHFFSSKVCARRCVGVVASGLCISRRLYSIACLYFSYWRVQHLPQLSRRTARSLDFMGECSLRFLPRRVCAFRYLEEHPSIQHQRRTDTMVIPSFRFLIFCPFRLCQWGSETIWSLAVP